MDRLDDRKSIDSEPQLANILPPSLTETAWRTHPPAPDLCRLDSLIAPIETVDRHSTGRPRRTKDGGSFLAGLGIGLAVGAAVALLLAPQSGADTRRALRRRGHRVKSRAGDAWSDLRYELSRAKKRALRRKRREARSMVEPTNRTRIGFARSRRRLFPPASAAAAFCL